MDIVFMNSKNIKTSDFHRLLVNITDKIKLKRSDRYVAIKSYHMIYMKIFKKNHSVEAIQYPCAETV